MLIRCTIALMPVEFVGAIGTTERQEPEESWHAGAFASSETLGRNAEHHRWRTGVLLAGVGFFISDGRGSNAPFYVLTGVGCTCLAVGARWVLASRPSGATGGTDTRSALPKRECDARSRKRLRLQYEDFDFGEPPPSSKQFGYAVSLGVEITDGMTKWMMSDAIDEAIERQRDGEPASQEQLRDIRAMHGVLPRKTTRGEARRVIEFLEDYSLPCPFCRVPIIARDESCCACNRSLQKLKIPIEID